MTFIFMCPYILFFKSKSNIYQFINFKLWIFGCLLFLMSGKLTIDGCTWVLLRQVMMVLCHTTLLYTNIANPVCDEYSKIFEYSKLFEYSNMFEYSNIFYRILDIRIQILKFSAANIFGYSNN